MIFNLAAPLTPICSTQGKKISTEKRCTRHEYLWMCLFVRAEVCAACGFMSIRVCVSVWGPCLCVNGHLGSGDHLTTKGLQWNGEREHMTGPEEFYEFICARCACVCNSCKTFLWHYSVFETNQQRRNMFVMFKSRGKFSWFELTQHMWLQDV